MSKFFYAAPLLVLLCWMVSPIQANVTGEGDVSPVGPVDLPIAGGTVEGDVVVGGTGFGTLTIDAPLFTDPLTSDNGEIGGTATGVGRVSVSGFSPDQSEWIINNELSVGVRGQGILEVVGGAKVSTGNGEGGEDPVLSNIFVGEFADPLNRSQGFVRVDGLGSLLATGTLRLGNQGDGLLEVLSSAMVTADRVFVAEEAGSTGEMILDGQGTRVLIANELEVGHSGNANLVVRNRAFLRSQNVMMGIDAGTISTATISDLGTVWQVTNDLSVGNNTDTSVGQVYINNRGLVQANGATTVSRNSLIDLDTDDLSTANSVGGTLRTLTLANSGLVRGHGRIESVVTNTTTGEIRNAAGVGSLRQHLLVTGEVTSDGVIESLGGEMTFESLVTNNASGNIVARDAILRFQDGLQNDGTLIVDGDTTIYGPITSEGDLQILPEGSTLLVGDLTLGNSNTLTQFIGSSETSLLVVDGDVSLAGILDVSFLNGLVATSEISFELISSTGTISGTFDTELLPEIPGLDLGIQYFSNSVVLTTPVPELLQADFNEDGDVDVMDLAAWQGGFGTMPGATKMIGDADLDGDVDGADFLAWQREFSLPPAVAAATQVPEPGSLVLVLSATMLLGYRRRRA